jgi:GntR family transcriptional regulator
MAAIEIDENDPTPLWAQLDRAIRMAIVTGRLRAGDRLPTVRQLAVELRVNANTVARVYAALEREGVLATKRGVGTFITDTVPPKTHHPHRERQLRAATDKFLTEATGLGYTPRQAVRALAKRVREGESS